MEETVMSEKKRRRRQWTTEEKVGILRRQFVDKVPVSALCEELGLQPSVFYQWQRQVFDNLAGALTTPASEGPSKREKQLAGEVARLEERVAKKDAVIAEISAEYVALKKELGEP
jgi:transposase-like protein